MAYDKRPTMRGHTLLIGGEMVTLWPVEVAGQNTLPSFDASEVVWFNHTENDWTEPYSLVEFALVNRWGWAFCSCPAEQVREAIKAEGGFIPLKRRDREALAACGNANI